MNYKVLARKWRPQTFLDVVGQTHVLISLKNSLQQKRLHHSYLFYGTRGIGKTTIARLFAKGLNCKTGISYNPCINCINCIEITNGRFVDLIEIDAASKTKVEDIRELLDNVQYAPISGRFKIYLIDEVHMLSKHSFNALLKTLEEPPKHVKFLLVTTNIEKIPITVLSRCFQFHLKALNINQIKNQIQHILISEKIPNDKYSCQLIAQAADGSLRDALNLTDQAIAIGYGKVFINSVSKMLRVLDDNHAISIIEAIVNNNGQKMMSLIEDIALYNNDWEKLLIKMLSFIHQIAMIQFSSKKIQDHISLIEKRLYILARSIKPIDLQFYYQILIIGRKELPYAPKKRMGIEMTLLRILTFYPKYTNDSKIELIQ